MGSPIINKLDSLRTKYLQILNKNYEEKTKLKDLNTKFLNLKDQYNEIDICFDKNLSEIKESDFLNVLFFSGTPASALIFHTSDTEFKNYESNLNNRINPYIFSYIYNTCYHDNILNYMLCKLQNDIFVIIAAICNKLIINNKYSTCQTCISLNTH